MFGLAWYKSRQKTKIEISNAVDADTYVQSFLMRSKIKIVYPDGGISG